MADRQLKIDAERVKADAERSARRAAEREALEAAAIAPSWEEPTH
jgi:hypothetical protein